MLAHQFSTTLGPPVWALLDHQGLGSFTLGPASSRSGAHSRSDLDAFGLLRPSLGVGPIPARFGHSRAGMHRVRVVADMHTDADWVEAAAGREALESDVVKSILRHRMCTEPLPRQSPLCL